jgi:anti-anti-sigma factor
VSELSVDVTATITVGALILLFRGELDHPEDLDIHELDALATLPPPPRLILDVSRLGVLSAAGARTIRRIAAACERRGVTTHLVLGAGTTVSRVAAISGLDVDVPAFRTMTDAVPAGALSRG